MTRRDLFIAGVPATGKTWLGEWLAKERGYAHIDAEINGGADFDRICVHKEWDAIFETGRATAFVDAIRALPKPVVVSWGLHPVYLFVVSALQAERIETWWLNAERHTAQKAFAGRKRGDPALFDRQMAEIERHWLLIRAVFGSHMVEGLRPDGSQRTPEELWDEMSSTRQSGMSP